MGRKEGKTIFYSWITKITRNCTKGEAMPNPQNLRKPTSEEAREMQKKSVEKRKENKTMREIYEEVIANKKNEIIKALNKGIDEGNLATLKELREATEGKTVNINADVKAEMLTTADLISEYKELAGLE